MALSTDMTKCTTISCKHQRGHISCFTAAEENCRTLVLGLESLDHRTSDPLRLATQDDGHARHGVLPDSREAFC
jgi:hypothetical protein